MTTIELTDKEAAQFIEWRANYANFDLLMRSGVMQIREGSFEAHFNANGEIGAIKAHVNVYKRDPEAAIVVIHSPLPVDKLAPQS
jgi:hypothetical protein